MTQSIENGRKSVTLRRYLARQLKTLRIDANKTVGDAVGAKIGSRSKVERIESARVGVKLATVIHMCQVYGADPETTNKLIQTVDDISTMGDVWWEAYAELTEWFRMFLELEAIADRAFFFEPRAMPGLLQCPEYQRAMFAGAPDAHERFEMRTLRQRTALERDEPLDLVTVIDESVFHRTVGDDSVMQAQRDHLHTLAERPGLEIRVLPYSAGAHPALLGTFTLLEFNEPEEPTVAYVESYLGASYASQNKVISDFRAKFDAVYALSVPIEEYLQDERRHRTDPVDQS